MALSEGNKTPLFVDNVKDDPENIRYNWISVDHGEDCQYQIQSVHPIDWDNRSCYYFEGPEGFFLGLVKDGKIYKYWDTDPDTVMNYQYKHGEC